MNKEQRIEENETAEAFDAPSQFTRQRPVIFLFPYYCRRPYLVTRLRQLSSAGNVLRRAPHFPVPSCP